MYTRAQNDKPVMFEINIKFAKTFDVRFFRKRGILRAHLLRN
jgi:hypothetical protein